MDNPITHNVELGTEVIIEPFCIIGQKDGPTTIIGDRGKIRSHTVIYGGNNIGSDFHAGHSVLIRENNTIGNHVSIGSQSNIEHHVTIEDDVRIHSGSFIPEFSHLKKGCWIGPKVCLTNARYPRSKRAKETLEGVTIEENAKIGANTTILPGITIGKNSLIGSGSVVTKDIPANSVAVGNPAKIVKQVGELRHDDGEPVYSE